MFVFSKEPQFKHTLSVQVPTNGGHDRQSLDCTYRVIGDEALALFDMNDRSSSSDFLRRAIVSLDDIVGADKQPVPYNDEVRDWLIDLPFVRIALVKGYFDAVYKATLGN